MSFIEIHIQHKDGKCFTNYGIGVDNKIEWFSTSEEDQSYLSGTLKHIQGQYLYCLIDPAKLLDVVDKDRSMISNPEILNNIDINDNYVIAKVSINSAFNSSY